MDKFNAFKKKLLIGKDGIPSTEHAFLLKHAKKLINMSRAEMGKHYSTWDYHDQIFRSRKVLDKEDRSANAKGQPAKMIVPLTFSQIMTFVSFCMMTTTQNTRFFELVPTGKEDMPLKEPIELILERDLRKNCWSAFLVQFFLDIGRFCLGAAEVCYKEEYRMIRVPQTQNVTGAFGIEGTEETNDFQQIPTFIGNKIYPVSPYRIFPDTRLPLTRFQDGEFCGSEDMFSMATLRSDSDNLFNLDKIPKMSEKDYVDRRKNTRIDVMDFMPTRSQDAPGEQLDKDALVKSGPVVITKLVADIIPNDFKLNGEDERPLGDEKFPIRYIIWYANDKTIVRFEEAYYLHCQFPYILSQFLPDQQKLINEGLADTCDQLQNTITWLTNAHITSIRSCMEGGKFIIDPAGIDIKGLESRSPYMFLKKNASQTGVDRYIKQFQVQDVTAGFMGDVSGLKELMENVTGYSAMMQGNNSPGRRSATQDRAVIQSGSARAKATLSTIWDTSFVSLGKQFIANNRQEMDFETFARILGQRDFGINPQTQQPFQIEEIYALFKADPVTIATSEDFFVFDATLPSEKSFLAQSLQEILVAIMSNPQMAQILGYGPEQIKDLFDEIYELRGVTPPYMPTPMPPPPQPGVIPMPPQQGAQAPMPALTNG